MQSQVRLSKRQRSEDEDGFDGPLRAVRDHPEDDAAWQRLEAECERTGRPDPAAEAYLRMLIPSLAPELRQRLARRAHAFYESWLGDDVDAVGDLLRRVLEIDPDTDWALDALVAALTATERWDALLEVYDQALTANLTAERRTQLLDEAAHAAKDFADRPERAIGYLRELLELDPRATALAASVARMLQERGSWRQLIELWQIQLAAGPATGAAELRLQTAEVYLDRLADPAGALEHASAVLESKPGDEAACALLGRVLSLDAASATLRLEALAGLRRHHDLAGRQLPTIAALETALGFAADAQHMALLRELTERLLASGDEPGALARYAELLRRAPDDVHARARLSHLAERSGDHEAHALALEAAADATPDRNLHARLLVGAMQVRCDQLRQQEQTLALGARVLALRDVQSAHRHQAATLMDRLLRGTDRHAERLSVLEALCSAEPSAVARRVLLAETARLARESGELSRAQRAWDARLTDDAADLEALAAAIELTGKLSLYDVQVARLRQRAQLATTEGQRRHDLVRVAELQATVLDDPDAAIATWLGVREEFGDAPDLLGTLDHLFTQTQRFADLARLYETATSQEHVACLENLSRLGDVYRLELSDSPAAARCYARAVGLAPDWEPGRAGLRALLGSKDCARQVTDALARAYEATDDWQPCVELLDARLEATDCTKTQAGLMLEVAGLCELRGCDARAALSLVAKALTRSPFDGHAERELLRLADLTGHYREAAVALGWAAAICSERERAADLRTHEARFLERLDDHAAAAAAYGEILKVRPQSRLEAHALVRSAARAGAWQLACDAALRSCQLRGMAEEEVLQSLERAAEEQAAYATLRDTFCSALHALDELSTALGCALEQRLSAWCAEHCDDLRGAEEAARRAIGHRPESTDSLRRLVDLQRRSGSPALIETLLALDARSADAIEPLHEAARLSLESQREPARQRELLRALYRRASALWAAQAAAAAVRDTTLADCVRWTLAQLVPLELSLGGQRFAVQLLGDAIRLPLDDADRARLGIQCARLLEQQGDLTEALRVGLSAFDRKPDDLELVRWLAALASMLERVPDELALRKRELTLSHDAERRLSLRLEIARLTGVLEAQDGRLTMLRANLGECCGHQASVEAACDLLSDGGRFPELVGLLSEQARGLESTGKHGLAAALWRRAARVAEQRMGDIEQAIDAYTQVADSAADLSSVEELVRLCQQVGDPGRTAHWLARQIELSRPETRVRLYERLAREQLSAERLDAAVDTLRAGFDEHPGDVTLRALFIAQLRAARRDQELAGVLARAAVSMEDQPQSVELAREAARLYHASMHDPAALVRTAEFALAIVPEDRELCLMLADGLNALGRRDEARQILLHLLALFGRRRSPERALVHAKLSEVLRDDGDLTGACAQLELALKMRSQDVTIMYALSELADKAGDLGCRERALHALRLAAKRGPVLLDGGRVLGASEILLQLSEVALARGDAAHASSLRESALEALRFGDDECERIKRYLSERDGFEVLEQILRKELAIEPRDVARAARMEQLAEVLDRQQPDSEGAFALRLSAVELDPANPRLHAAALGAARQRGERSRFRALLQGLLERARRPGDAYARCEVCLRLGEAWFEEDALDDALKYYREAEATGVREGDVWRAQLRVATQRGDARLQDVLLSQLASLGEAELEAEGRGDVLYRMAEIRLGSDATHEEGIACLREAVALAPHAARVTRLLSRALVQGPYDPDLLALLSQLACGCSETELLQVGELYAEHGDEAVLDALLAPFGAEPKAKELEAGIRAKRAGRLLNADPSSEAARSMLREALALSPSSVEAEDMLLQCFARSGEQAEAAQYVLQRFEHVRDANDVEGCVRYALKLQDFAAAAGDAGLAALRAATKLNPEHVELWRALRRRLSTPEQADERAHAIERLLELNGAPDAARAALEAADIHERRGDLAAAVRVLRSAGRDAPPHGALQQRLIEACRRQNDPAALAALLEELARSEREGSRAAELWQEAASLWRDRLDDLGATANALEAAVAAIPEHPGLRRELVEALLAVGRDEDAIEQLAHAVVSCNDPRQRAALLHVRGNLLLDRGQLLEGVCDLERACALLPETVESGLLDAAEDMCRRVADRIDPSIARSATLKLISIRRLRGELAEAVTLLEARLAREPHDDEMLRLAAEVYAELERPTELARVCMTRMALHEGETQIALAHQLAALMPQLSDPADALFALSRAHERRPDCAELEQALMDAHTAVSDHGALSRLWIARARRAEDPAKRAECLHLAAKHMVTAGATESALRLLERVRSAFPDHLDVTLTLAATLMSERRLPEARNMLEAALEPRPDARPAQRAPLLAQLSRVAHAQGDHDAALSYMQAARDADKNSRSILAELAVLAQDLGAWEVAERSLIALLMLKQPEAMPRFEVLLRRSRVALHLGGPSQALIWARKAQEAAPASEEAAALLSELQQARASASSHPSAR